MRKSALFGAKTLELFLNWWCVRNAVADKWK